MLHSIEVSQNKYNLFFDLCTYRYTFLKKYSFNFKQNYQNELKEDIVKIQEGFGMHLKKIREDKGLSLRELSTNCDLDYSKISRMENGKTNVQLSTIFELAKGLGIKAKELLDF